MGSVKLREKCVVFSAFAGDNKDLWDQHAIEGVKLTEELQEPFPRKAGSHQKMVYEVEYHQGLTAEPQMMKYAVYIKICYF